MHNTLGSLVTEAMNLSSSERNELMDALLKSLEPEDVGNVDEAWAKEVEKRFVELQRGSVKPISWSRVKQKAVSKSRD